MLKTEMKRALIIALGCAACGAAVNLFYVPNNLLSGGVGGVSLILYFALGAPLGITIILLNVPLFLFAYRLMDRHYTIVSLYGMLMFAFFLDAFGFLASWKATDDLLIAALCGGLGNGVGSALMYRVNGGSGGTDIIGAILNKYYGISYGTVSFAINGAIMLMSIFLFGLKPAVYTLLAIFIAARVTDKVTAGFDDKKILFIISPAYEKIAVEITGELGRGLTFLSGEGAYTRTERKVIFVVIKLTQIAKIKALVYKHDPQAFMIVQEATDVMGKGFTIKSDHERKKELLEAQKRARLKNIARIHRERLEGRKFPFLPSGPE